MAGAQFHDFADVHPPSNDIHKEILHNFFEHIDPYAAGFVPIQGWAFDPSGVPVHLAVYLDGKLQAHLIANLDRADVPDVDPTVTTPNVSWRTGLDFRREENGVHTLEVFLEQPGKRLVRITRRGLTVVARDQSPSLPLPFTEIDTDAQIPNAPVRVNIDAPAPLMAVFYNPLAELWLQYRNQVVFDYIASFAKIADKSCLPQETVFWHQLLPEMNSSWDSDLDAVNLSQLLNPNYNQGTTLYGGATWGQAFFNWKSALGWKTYAVSEMHPRFHLPLAQLDEMFDMHRLQGAKYVAPCFLSIEPLRLRLPLKMGLSAFLIDPANHLVG